MWCQWSAAYRLGDDPIRSTQHEYRLPTIIQLDEVAPPPPSSQKPLLSPVPSSSQSYDHYSSSEECEEVEDEEDEEEATQSYCSSDPSCLGLGVEDPERAPVAASVPVEQTTRMSRVLAWRNSFDDVFAEDNAGVFCLCLSPHRWHLALPFPCYLASDDFGSVRVLTYPIARHPHTCHRSHTWHYHRVDFFSRNLPSPAALMSLKRKYSHETEDGENEEGSSQPRSDAVSPCFLIKFPLFHSVLLFPLSRKPYGNL